MKKTHLLSTLILTFFCSVSIWSQKVEKTFVPYYLQEGKVESFEVASSKIEAKAIGYGGFGGVNNYLTVFNSKTSPLRFKVGELPKFVIEVDEDVDVFELVVISKADKVKKKKTYRRFIQAGSSYGGGAKDLSKYVFIPTLKKIKGNLYEMLLDRALDPGEYSFLPIFKGAEAANLMTTSKSMKIYCFGID